MTPLPADQPSRGRPRQTRSAAGLVSVLVANQPVSLRQISRTGFVMDARENCCAGRVLFCSFRVSTTLTVTLQARCVSCGWADGDGVRLSRFEFIDSDSEASDILDSALNAWR